MAHESRKRHHSTANANQEYDLELQPFYPVHVGEVHTGAPSVVGAVTADGVRFQIAPFQLMSDAFRLRGGATDHAAVLGSYSRGKQILDLADNPFTLLLPGVEALDNRRLAVDKR